MDAALLPICYEEDPLEEEGPNVLEIHGVLKEDLLPSTPSRSINYCSTSPSATCMVSSLLESRGVYMHGFFASFGTLGGKDQVYLKV